MKSSRRDWLQTATKVRSHARIQTQLEARMIASAGAAAARIRALHEEEERLTIYSADDLAQGWEFKIVRANTAAFRKRDVMQQVCEEQAC